MDREEDDLEKELEGMRKRRRMLASFAERKENSRHSSVTIEPITVQMPAPSHSGRGAQKQPAVGRSVNLMQGDEQGFPVHLRLQVQR